MNVFVILVVCVLAAVATRALQTKFFPKSVPAPKDYAEHAKFVAIYAGSLVVASALSYVLVPMAAAQSNRSVPSVQQLHVMMKDRVSDAPVPSITKVV
jgi:hypothetical protein